MARYQITFKSIEVGEKKRPMVEVTFDNESKALLLIDEVEKMIVKLTEMKRNLESGNRKFQEKRVTSQGGELF